jgi:hypothetical protein
LITEDAPAGIYSAMDSRAVLPLALVAGCSFSGSARPGGSDSGEVGGHQGGDAATPDAARTVDAAIDAPPDAPPDAPHTCPGYVAASSGGSSSYKKYAGMNWAAAKSKCQSDGAHLVIPETNAEARAVFTFVNPANNSPYYWAGVSDPEFDGTWTTVLGQPFTPSPWGASQPTHNTGEIYLLVDSAGQFYDFHDAPQEFACECEP